MLKRFTVFMAFALVLSFVLPVVAQDEITLRWRTRPDNQAEIDVYTAASETIDAALDGISLEYEPGGSETAGYQDVLVTEIEAGTAPDVFWIPGTDIARFAEAGLILNLADIAAADEDYSQDNFYAGPMEFLTTSIDGNEALWGLPRDVSAFAIYYNADLFDEAGLDYPTEMDSWDWDAFLEAAEEINALGDDISGFGMNAWWANWGYFVNAAGGSFFNETYTDCALNTEESVAGLAFADNLYNEGLAVPYGTDSEPPFLAGSVGMFINGRWATPGAVANADFNWTVAPLPAGPAGDSNWIFWGAYVVNANTENPEAAWELVTQLTSAEIQGQIASLGANIPSRSTDAAIELFMGTFDGAVNNQAFIDGLNAGVTEAPLFNGNWPAIDQAYNAGVTSILNGDLSPEEFGETICQQVAGEFES